MTAEKALHTTLPTTLPQHIAIIMDGNGRWARQRFRPRFWGHQQGVARVRELVAEARRLAIPHMTLFAFSSENWSRPPKEVAWLMKLFLSSLRKEVGRLRDNKVRLRIVGDTSRFDATLQQAIEQAEQETAEDYQMTLNIAANYGGRWDTTQAVRQLARQVQAGTLQPDAISEQTLSEAMVLRPSPEVDLLIRTGGEVRISNFLLWDLCYSELYFTDILWPDFKTEALHDALRWYATRQRRFGKTGEQVQQDSDA